MKLGAIEERTMNLTNKMNGIEDKVDRLDKKVDKLALEMNRNSIIINSLKRGECTNNSKNASWSLSRKQKAGIIGALATFLTAVAYAILKLLGIV